MSVLPERYGSPPRPAKRFGVGAVLLGSNPPTIEASIRTQAGTVVQTTSLGGDGTVTFPIPFLNGLISVIVIQGDTTVPLANPVTHTYTLTNFVIRTFNSNTGAVMVGVLIRYNWMAIGW